MSIFSNKYPYTDFHELNADWILEKINELDEEVNNIETDILDKANAYTDAQITERLADVESQYAAFKTEVNEMISDLDDKYDTFVTTVNLRMSLTDQKFARLSDKVDSVLGQANAYTNFAIDANNTYIIDQTTKALDTVTVLNYFTGARVSIQAMFDYLSQFHLNNAISVQTLVDRSKTVNALVALNMTMTDLATNGGTIITP